MDWRVRQMWSEERKGLTIVKRMPVFIFLMRAAAVAAAALPFSLTAAQTPPATVKLDAQQVEQASDALYRSIAGAVTAAGGTPETTHLNLAIGFSTGHFASDPGMAEAARAIASALVNRHLVNGDVIHAYAWEMNVWPYQDAAGQPFTVTSSAPGSTGKTDVNRLWPRSARPGSTGGHDTENAAVEISRNLDKPQETVIVLLTNTAYSVASATEKPIGESSSAYSPVAKTYTRVPAVNSSGASVALPFRELTSGRDRHLDAVLFVPTSYQAGTLDGASRSTLLTTSTDRAPAASGRKPSPLLWVALGVIAAALVAWLLLRRRPSGTTTPAPRAVQGGTPTLLDVDGQTVSLAAPGSEVRLVRRGYAPPDERTIVLAEGQLPTVLARFVIGRKDLEIKLDKNVRLGAIDGKEATTASLPLRAGVYRLDFKGTYQDKESLPPKPFTTTVRIRLSSAPATPGAAPSPR